MADAEEGVSLHQQASSDPAKADHLTIAQQEELAKEIAATQVRGSGGLLPLNVVGLYR
jgi:hypothetical protein